VAERKDMITLLAARHPGPRWAFFPEVRNSTGYTKDPRTIDAMAIGTWPSDHGQRIAYELKKSRGDFLRELDNPQKRKWVEDHCHQTYFVVPRGLITKDEVPTSWGLIEAGAALKATKIAPVRKPEPMPETMVMALLRRASEDRSQAVGRTFGFEGGEIDPEQLRKIVHEATQTERTLLETERERVRKKMAQAIIATDKLFAPLVALCKLANGGAAWSFTRQLEEGVEYPTADQVESWIQLAVSKGLNSKIALIRDVHKAAGSLIEHLERP
jgi:hypothetical protein